MRLPLFAEFERTSAPSPLPVSVWVCVVSFAQIRPILAEDSNLRWLQDKTDEADSKRMAAPSLKLILVNSNSILKHGPSILGAG